MSPSADGPPLGSWKLVTVNTAPERAKLLIGRMIERVRDQCTVIHAGNVEGMLVKLASCFVSNGRHLDIQSVRSTVEKIQPDLLVSTLW
jgi:hypothetical protein